MIQPAITICNWNLTHSYGSQQLVCNLKWHGAHFDSPCAFLIYSQFLWNLRFSYDRLKLMGERRNTKILQYYVWVSWQSNTIWSKGKCSRKYNLMYSPWEIYFLTFDKACWAIAFDSTEKYFTLHLIRPVEP